MQSHPKARDLSSPRKRGCFLAYQALSIARGVFPAQAGVFPLAHLLSSATLSLPRASGGVSAEGLTVGDIEESSPRKRGCFPSEVVCEPSSSVFPAQAGVFPLETLFFSSATGLPRASGGVSRRTTQRFSSGKSSPRKRGCFCRSRAFQGGQFVFPAQAGVFLFELSVADVTFKSSPRKRGCFSLCGWVTHRHGVFPAQAGVFPWAATMKRSQRRLPRASGGVSQV